jgi:hypothetical protein
MTRLVKNTLLSVLVLFGALAAVLALAFAGCHQALYPFARAFGSPPESELALSRAAFQQLRTRLATSRVRVQPVCFTPDLSQPSRQWRADWAQSLARAAGERTKARFELAPSPPDIGPTPFGPNQMRYLWKRSAEYGRWLRASPPGTDYVWCVEIFGFHGKVGAIQVYVFDAHGQVAYCRLFNSHHFGDALSVDGEQHLRLVFETLFKDLSGEPEAIFPPCGVG